MIDAPLVGETVAAFLLGGLCVWAVPRAVSVVRHRGLGHGFRHAFGYHVAGVQHDMQICECGAFRQILHDGRVCTH